MALNPYAGGGSSLNPYAGSPAAKPAGQYSMPSLDTIRARSTPAASIYGSPTASQTARAQGTPYNASSYTPQANGYGNAQMRGQSTNLGFTSGSQYNAGSNAGGYTGTLANTYTGQGGGYQAPARQPSLLDPNNSSVSQYRAQPAAQPAAQPQSPVQPAASGQGQMDAATFRKMYEKTASDIRDEWRKLRRSSTPEGY